MLAREGAWSTHKLQYRELDLHLADCVHMVRSIIAVKVREPA